MSILDTAQFSSFANRPGVTGGAPPSEGPFADLIGALSPVGVWPLSGSSASTFSDAAGTSPGEWVSGAPEVQRPTLVDDDAAGHSSEFNSIRGAIPYAASHETANGGVFLVVQTRDAAPKQTLVARANGPETGRWIVEIQASGAVRATIRDATAVRELIGPVLTKGLAYGIALTWGAAGGKLYVQSGTPAATHATTQGSAGESEITVGSWHVGDIDRLSGLMGWLVMFSAQPSDEQVGVLMDKVKTAGVTYASADASSTAEDTVVDINVLANDHYQGTKAAATVAITQQGARGFYSVLGDNNLRYAAGSTTGIDAEGRYTVNGVGPGELTMEVTVSNGGSGAWAPDEFIALPSGFGTWTIAWDAETAGMTQSIINANQNRSKNGVFPWRRYSMNSPDSRPAFRDRFDYPQQIEPIGFDSPHLTAGPLVTLNNIRYLLLRWHYWCTDDWGEEGKWMIINGGRGWIGPGYSKSNTTQYGSDGFGINSMHPRTGGDTANNPGGQSIVGGFGSHSTQSSSFGRSLARTGARAVPGAWRVFDQIVDLGSSATATDGAYRVHLNGTQVASLTNIRAPQTSAANCKGIWMRVRPMSGGTPANLTLGHNPGDHFYGGFFMGYVAR